MRPGEAATLASLILDDEMFAAAVMKSTTEVAFEAMKVAQLKEELAARDSTRTALKAVLQRRLHALLLVQAAIQARADEGRSGEAARRILGMRREVPVATLAPHTGPFRCSRKQ